MQKGQSHHRGAEKLISSWMSDEDRGLEAPLCDLYPVSLVERVDIPSPLSQSAQARPPGHANIPEEVYSFPG